MVCYYYANDRSLFDSVGLTASCFGIGATMSNFLGQVAVQYLGHVASLVGSFALSFVSLGIFGMFMPETLGRRNENGININNILESNFYLCGGSVGW